MTFPSGDVARAVSWLFGWVYFSAWTASFFPQAILNFQRKTAQGLVPDFPILNIFGFSCYGISTVLFLSSDVIRDQYASRHPLSPESTVRINDVAFGLVGLFMSIVTYSQFWPKLWRWERISGVRKTAGTMTLGLIWGSLLALAVVIMAVFVNGNGSRSDGNGWAWIDVVYATQYVKILVTIFKYIPQAISNYRRKSTIGWSIIQQLLDLTGGVLSLGQLVIDSSLQADWSGLSGNPLKIGLAMVSMSFDMIFIAQHYLLYGPVEEREGYGSNPVDSSRDLRDEREPLLPRAGSM